MKMLIKNLLACFLLIYVTNTAAQIKFPSKHRNPTKAPTPGQVISTKFSNNAANIVHEKCLEYSKARFVIETIPAQTPLDKDRNVTRMNCVPTEPTIVGGVPAISKEFPHMAVIGYVSVVSGVEWICGGSLISDRYVLTAAHCKYVGGGGFQMQASLVRLGELVLNSEEDNATPKDFSIVEFITYPDYKEPQVYHDIMLLKLNETVVFTPYIRPICLYSRMNPPANFENNFIVTGWGKTGIVDTQSDELRKTRIVSVKDDECSQLFKRDKSKYPDGMKTKLVICAGDKIGGNDTCLGDSGGPLQTFIPEIPCMYYQLGITSFGHFSCGQKDVPAIYTRIAPYISWIQSNVWP